MHIIQQKLLKLSEEKNLSNMTLREIGKLIGENLPQKIKHHLTQLEKKGFINIAKNQKSITRTRPGKIKGTSTLLSVPILGTANCGPATFYAESNYEGYLKISTSLLHKKKDVYAIKASGLSMNKATIKNNTIDDGDYLIIDSTKKSPENGDVVVSVFDNVANVKRFYYDRENKRITLMSNSTSEYPPIFIHENDEFNIAGTVVQVVKKPKL